MSVKNIVRNWTPFLWTVRFFLSSAAVWSERLSMPLYLVLILHYYLYLVLYLYLYLMLVCICTFVSLYIQCGFPLRQCRSLVRRTVNVFESGLIHTDRTLKMETKKNQKNCVLSMFLFLFDSSCHRQWVMETQAITAPYYLESLVLFKNSTCSLGSQKTSMGQHWLNI